MSGAELLVQTVGPKAVAAKEGNIHVPRPFCLISQQVAFFAIWQAVVRLVNGTLLAQVDESVWDCPRGLAQVSTHW